MNNAKVSVLIPVYNVSLYIEKCAHSLFRQTFQDIEYIFVNDATPDDSIEKLNAVLEQYPNRKNQVKIINHTHNRGLAAARNTAIDASSGEYISVVDSDDYVEPEMIEVLYDCIKKNNADIAVSDIIIEHSNKSITQTDIVADTKEERLYNIICEIGCIGLWNKLVNRKLYEKNDCRVPEGLNYYEDRHVMIRIYYYANKVAKIDNFLYHYTRHNNNSITKTKNRIHFENVIQYWILLDSFFKEKGLLEQYRDAINLFKIKNKAELMFGTNQTYLRKEFANIFIEEEDIVKKKIKKGFRIMLFLIRNKLFRFAKLYYNLSILKYTFCKQNVQY